MRSEWQRRTLRLLFVESQARQCDGCALATTRNRVVFGRGNPLASVLFLGEAPGEKEDASGEPFCGKAGELLDEMVAFMGLGRDDAYVCNVVKCRPPENRKPTPDEMRACNGFLRQQIDIVRPKVIVALGTTAAEALGVTIKITLARGRWYKWEGYDVMPTYHPAYCFRRPAAKDDVRDDLRKVMERLAESAEAN